MELAIPAGITWPASILQGFNANWWYRWVSKVPLDNTGTVHNLIGLHGHAWQGVRCRNHKKFWMIKALIKVRDFLWVTIQNKILTQEVLITSGCHITQGCVLSSMLRSCNWDKGSHFLVIPCAGYFWKELETACGVVNPIAANTQTITQLWYSSISVADGRTSWDTIWALWCERNKRRFAGETKQGQLVHKTYVTVWLWTSVLWGALSEAISALVTVILCLVKCSLYRFYLSLMKICWRALCLLTIKKKRILDVLYMNITKLSIAKGFYEINGKYLNILLPSVLVTTWNFSNLSKDHQEQCSHISRCWFLWFFIAI